MWDQILEHHSVVAAGARVREEAQKTLFRDPSNLKKRIPHYSVSDKGPEKIAQVGRASSPTRESGIA